MRTKMIILMTVAFFMMIPAGASAAYLPFSYTNHYETDRIEFNIVGIEDPALDITFANINFPGYEHEISSSVDWNFKRSNNFHTLIFQPDSVSTIAEGTGVFNLWLFESLTGWLPVTLDSYNFTLEWTEYLGAATQGSGQILFEEGVDVLYTPIPASAWMLMSGLAIFVGIRRHRAG